MIEIIRTARTIISKPAAVAPPPVSVVKRRPQTIAIIMISS